MTSALAINGVLGLLPVLAFLAMLTQADIFKLARRDYVVMLIASGAAAALASYFAGRAFMRFTGVGYDEFAALGGPVLEEAFKALVVVCLIRANRIGFVLDAVIAGFAIGAGFALLENYFYLRVLGDGNPAIWVVRGFGSAIMHGGATAIFAVLAQMLTPQEKKGSVLRFLPGFAAAVALHALFNRFLDYPVASTIVMMVGLAIALGFIQHRDRQSIDQWLNVDFDDYRRLLADLRTGDFGDDNFGRAIASLRVRFDPAEIAEIVEYAKLHTELVLFAEEILKAQARGEALDVPEEVKEKLAHFHYLEERIGGAVRLVLREHFKFSRYEFFQLYKLQRDAGGIAQKAHAFNTDLMLDEADREAARDAYPDVYFALENQALADAFLPFDRRANLSKTRSRRLGTLAVWLGVGGLSLAGAELLYRDIPAPEMRIVAGAGALMLVAAVVIGAFGVITRGRKMRWLADRLATERIRQFHFQHYVAHFDAILAGASNAKAADDYRKARAQDFERFSRDFLDHVDERLHTIVHEEDCGDGVLAEAGAAAAGAAPPTADTSHLQQYFSAYSRLRFDRQINYCNHVLRESRSFWKRSAMKQAQLLGAIALAGIAGVLFFHGLVFVGALSGQNWMRADLIHVFGLWAAVAALAARTFEEGLQPKREIERMRQYRLDLRRANARFRAATSAAEKLAAMRDMERLTYQEMATFLKSSYESGFVM